MSSTSLFVVAFCLLLLLNRTFSLDYKAALSKSLLYYEAQRSGKLPPNQRVQWRSDSGMKDGSDAGIDLVGGYYDGGDHVKYGFPMAFTVTMLAWSAVEFRSQLEANHELSNTLDAIKWGTDYFIKAHPKPNLLYGQVGDVVSDYKCWRRPEDMTTPRTSYKIDEAHPGSDLAGETAAAFAAAAIVFNKTDPAYSSQLLTHAKQLFDFATKHKGKYQNSISVADRFYTSTGYEDELLWAAAWLYRATLDKVYLDILHTNDSGCTRTIFNWDDKYVGSQVLVAKLVLDGTFNGSDGIWTTYKKCAEKFICNIVQKGNNNAQMTNGGLLWWNPWNDLQYATSATFIVTAYSDYLTTANLSLQCPGGLVSSNDMIKFARSQVDYILGQNPRNTSYMVGFGSKYPQQIHHRGSSIISIKTNSTPVACKEGYDIWFKKNASNPNVLHGAIVTGPYKTDSYWDSRYNIMQGKPVTANTAPFVGVLARMA